MSQSLAPKAPFAAPTFDRLSIRVVVDSAYDLLAPKFAHPDEAVQRRDVGFVDIASIAFQGNQLTGVNGATQHAARGMSAVSQSGRSERRR
jgi:hypothetical protein